MKIVEANGARIPALGLGTWELRGEVAERIVECALEVGYRHIDTAQMYGNEREVGRAIRTSGIPREEIFLTTKIWPDRFRRGDLQRSVEESLGRLGVSRVDLLLLHWPNPEVSLAETMEALLDVHARGWTRWIGVSNFTVALMEEAARLAAPVPLVANQVEYHPFLSQRRVLAACRRLGMALVAYCPLARGRVFESPVIRRIAERHGRNPAQVALRWLIQQEGVAAIPRSAKPEHVKSNFDIWDFELSPEEMAEISALGSPAGRIVALPGLAPAWDAE